MRGVQKRRPPLYAHKDKIAAMTIPALVVLGAGLARVHHTTAVRAYGAVILGSAVGPVFLALVLRIHHGA